MLPSTWQALLCIKLYLVGEIRCQTRLPFWIRHKENAQGKLLGSGNTDWTWGLGLRNKTEVCLFKGVLAKASDPRRTGSMPSSLVTPSFPAFWVFLCHGGHFLWLLVLDKSSWLSPPYYISFTLLFYRNCDWCLTGDRRRTLKGRPRRIISFFCANIVVLQEVRRQSLPFLQFI